MTDIQKAKAPIVISHLHMYKLAIAFMWAISVNGSSQARTKLRDKDNKKAGASQPPKDYRTELYSASCRLGKLDF